MCVCVCVCERQEDRGGEKGNWAGILNTEDEKPLQFMW